MSYVGNNKSSDREIERREQIEYNLLKFKTGAKKIKWLHKWAEGKNEKH